MIFSVSLLIHIIGVGLIFAGIVSIPIVESMFRTAVDAKSAHTLHKVITRIGVVTPIATALLLLSGITNIIAGHIVVMQELWLVLKLLFFAAMGAVGMVQGKAYRTRGRLVEAIALGDAPATAPGDVEMFTRRLSVFGRAQILLLLLVLIVTLFRSAL